MMCGLHAAATTNNRDASAPGPTPAHPIHVDTPRTQSWQPEQGTDIGQRSQSSENHKRTVEKRSRRKLSPHATAGHASKRRTPCSFCLRLERHWRAEAGTASGSCAAAHLGAGVGTADGPGAVARTPQQFHAGLRLGFGFLAGRRAVQQLDRTDRSAGTVARGAALTHCAFMIRRRWPMMIPS